MSAVGLAVFVKTPGRSPLKTRLWPELGQDAAEEFFRRSARAVASVVDRAATRGALHPYWAVAEADALDDAIWANWPRLAQGEGGLGARMHAVYTQLLARHGAALLLGADAPQLRATSVLRAARLLQGSAPQLLIGRAMDGGFWTFGGNVALPQSLWESVTYSRTDTAHSFMQAMTTCAPFKQLPTLTDVDTLAEFSTVVQALQSLKRPTPAQRQLARWMAHTQQAHGVVS